MNAPLVLLPRRTGEKVPLRLRSGQAPADEGARASHVARPLTRPFDSSSLRSESLRATLSPQAGRGVIDVEPTE